MAKISKVNSINYQRRQSRFRLWRSGLCVSNCMVKYPSYKSAYVK